VTSRHFDTITLTPPEAKTSCNTRIIKASMMKFDWLRVEAEKEILARSVLEEKPIWLHRGFF